MNSKLKILSLAISLLVITLLIMSCSNPPPTTSPAPSTTPAPSSTTTTESTSTTTTTEPAPAPTTEPTPVTLEEMADNVTCGEGKVMSISEAAPEKVVFIFEEAHNSRLGQVEIAMMFDRLYTNYGLRHIGLEGYIAGNGPLSLGWAQSEPYFEPGQMITGREDVIIQTLEDGEISAAEMLGLIYHDAIIDGIDDAELYGIEASDKAWAALTVYLYNIALIRMSSIEHTAWDTMYDEGKYDDAREFAFSTDEFVTDTIARMNDSIDIVQDEEWPPLIDSVKEEAQKAGLEMTAETEGYLAELRDYFEHYVATRSDTMAANMLKVTDAYPGAPMAMEIGASHTSHIEELLTGAGVSVVVIRALSMVEENTNGWLSDEAYERKVQGLSVDPEGFLGSFLDGRMKPPTFADTPVYQQEVEIRVFLQAFNEEVERLKNYPNILPNGLIEGLNKWINTYLSGKTLEGSTIRGVAISVDMPLGSNSILSADVGFKITLANGQVLEGKFASLSTLAKFMGPIQNRLQKSRENLINQSHPITEPTPDSPITTYQQICSNTGVYWQAANKTD